MNTDHKKTYRTLLFLILFLLALIATIFVTQYNSQKKYSGLIKANLSAAATFDVNNRLESIINLTEAVEQNCREFNRTGNRQIVKRADDTIKIIENHLSIIKEITAKNQINTDVSVLAGLVTKKTALMKNFLANREKNYSSDGFRFTDSLVGGHLDEAIYSNALELQRNLEKNLKRNLSESSAYSERILRLDKLLSIIAIMAVLILGTFIIRRLLAQVGLINRLEVEKTRADNSAMIKEQFLANMSHEIRTPINAVIGFSGLLQKTTLENDQKQFADLIQKSGENLLAVVNDILDISKLEAGMMRFTKNPFSLSETCHTLEMMFYHKAAEKNISFSCQIDERVPDTLIGDAERLNQVLVNLVNNAIKFTSEGEVTVDIKVNNLADNFADLLFSVRDTGIGIPKNKLSSVFGRFEQADSNTSRQYGGTGLGLSIVKKIINQQGGDITVESEPGKGSEFVFNLRFGYIENPDQIEFFTAAQNSEKIEFGTIKALVAEDNVTNQTLLKYTLKQWDLNFDLAQNGLQAIELFQKNKYDIILMDIQMPVMDGYEAAHRIRNDYKATLPIVAMTAHVLPTEREKCINAGMNDYISKPIKEAEFLKVLRKYLPHSSVKTEKKAAGQNNSKKEYRYVDILYLNKIFASNSEFIKEIMYLFRENYPKELRQLQHFTQNQNLEGVKNTAHHLKTTVSSLSIDTPLRIHLDKIEDFAREESWDRIKQEISVLVQKEEAVLREINTIITAN